MNTETLRLSFNRLVKSILLLLLLLFCSPLVAGGSTEPADDPVAGRREGIALPIPPLMQASDAELVTRRGEISLPGGSAESLGFNGDYLGPTLIAERGDLANILVRNELGENTTVHWHGMHIPAEFDGGPHQVIADGQSWNPQFTINQQAATLWYHPHLMGKTADQVYGGLAGLFIIEDDYSRSLELPNEYGVNDIPLVLQERRLESDGSFPYRPSMPDVMHGYAGNTLLVNGAVEPVLERGAGTYRLRVLNGSNSSILFLSFSDGRSFSVIAGDGGFLPQSVERKTLPISPAERFEILVDLQAGDNVQLLVESSLRNGAYIALNLRGSNDERAGFLDHEWQFHTEQPQFTSAENNRQFLMESRGMGNFSINGSQMDMNIANFEVQRNVPEIWTIINVQQGMMAIPHSFHVHDVQFTVLSINGEPPPPMYSGPKDTVILMSGWHVQIALEFKDYTGLYMYHCHFLEHEDAGMMGQFLVQ